MPLNLSNVSITIPTEVVSQLKQVFLPTDDERQKFAAACDSKAIAQELIDMHGDPLVNSIIDTGGTRFASSVAEQIDTSDIASEVAERIDVSLIAQEIDTSEIASEVAREIDLCDLAEELSHKFSAHEIAEQFSDRDIAREIDCSDIAAELDHEEIASHIHVDEEVIARECVKWMTTNSDGMSHFLHAFCKAYIEATSNAVRS